MFQNKRDVVHALSGIEHEAIFPFARMDEDKYFFVKYYYDENGDEIPALFVIDARTKEVIGKADDVIDFKVQDGKIIVYCHGHIDIIER